MFLDFLDSEFKRIALHSRATEILNFAKIMYIKNLRNPAYDFESAVQCLDFTPLTNQ